MPNPSNGTAVTDDASDKASMNINGNATPSSNSSSNSSSSSNSVNLLTAYILWCLGGVFGLHHAYLNRPHQGLGWYATSGLFGCGLLRDLYRMPHYVSLAQNRSDNVAAKVRAATVQLRNGVPRMSPARMALMGLFGGYFGWVASCLVALPEEGAAAARESGVYGAVYGVLRSLGAAAGVWLVGNMGEETLGDGNTSHRGEFARHAACCLAGFAILDRPVLGGICYAVIRRRYRPSMMISPTATSSATKRVGRHLLACAVFTALLALATYNHGSIVVNDQQVYFKDALRNAFNSKFWQEFDWTQFREEYSSRNGGRDGGSDYLKNVFDLQGGRAARRTLGVAKNASHNEVRAAYKKLALKYHPDKVGSNATEREVEETKRQFVKVQEAYEVLNEIEQRRKKGETAKEESRQQQQQQQQQQHQQQQQQQQQHGSGRQRHRGGARGRSNSEESEQQQGRSIESLMKEAQEVMEEIARRKKAQQQQPQREEM